MPDLSPDLMPDVFKFHFHKAIISKCKVKLIPHSRFSIIHECGIKEAKGSRGFRPLSPIGLESWKVSGSHCVGGVDFEGVGDHFRDRCFVLFQAVEEEAIIAPFHFVV